MPFWVKLIGAAGAQSLPPAHQPALRLRDPAPLPRHRERRLLPRARPLQRQPRPAGVPDARSLAGVEAAGSTTGPPHDRRASSSATPRPRQLALRLHAARARHGGAGAPARLHRARRAWAGCSAPRSRCCSSARSTTPSRSASRSPSCSPASGLAGMVHTARNLARIAVSAGRAEPVFAGEAAQFRLYLDGRARARPARRSSRATSARARSSSSTCRPRGVAEVVLAVPAPRARLAAARPRDARDALSARPVPRLELRRARRALPGLSAAGALAAAAAERRGRPRAALRSPTPGNDDFAGLRGYQPADSPRHVAWKAVARSDEHADQAVRRRGGRRAVARLAAAAGGLGLEQRLSRLAGWVLAAERRGARYGLRLPGVEIAPGRGDAHRAACLQALALYEPPMSAVAAPARARAPAPVSARDLAWLIASLVLVIAPHALRAPWWLTLLTLCLFALALLLRAQPRAAAFALAGARRRRGGDARRLDRVPHALRPQPGIVLLVLFSGLKLLETRTPPRRRGGRVPRLLPDHHQLPLHAVDPDRRADVRGAVRAHRHAGRLQRAAARAARQPAHRRPAARARRAGGARRCSCSFRACRARSGACRRTPTPGMTGLSDTMTPGQPRQPGAVRRHRLPRRVRGRRRRRTRCATGAARCCGTSTAAPGASGRAAWSRLRAAERRARAPTATAWCSSRTTARGCSRSRRAASLPERSRMTLDGQVLAAAPVRARMRYEMTSVDRARARRRRGQPARCAARCACRRTSTRAPRALAARVARGRAQRRRGAGARDRLPAPGPLRIHARAAAARRGSVDEFLFDTKRGLLRALLLGVRVPDARGRRAGARGHRLPGRRTQSGRQHHHRAPVRRARLGRGVPRPARLGARRPDRGRGARAASSPAWRAPCRRAPRCR